MKQDKGSEFQRYWNQFKLGVFMGGIVGCCIGFVFGNMAYIQGRRVNMSQRYLRTVFQYMATSGASFGLFMGVGSVLRNDSDRSPEKYEAWRQFVRIEGKK
ncbi:hypothetical protein ROZALSC1DRAFT_27232 [Rozella allomycis CSF55]|uniref:Uncharacterized protein n=1 Tax=Rozella allomycis (strain CSF55) TaxID=988480 RepID=A0A075AZM8_ROZAC|nr:hypothetical protein O9G_003269 [Rozella allomycis CSF55]RKP21365.1 hypothetical protein ROZALSC1DRAFT_27232 [Rozella allomycis CSF55]|eukprot:EPZ35786.1 hypothetical protein O9G_003269 [Rozella allomycis CSF55]